MPLSDFSVHVGDALLKAFPQFEDYVKVEPDRCHLEIHFPHPRAHLELFITTASDEISVFLGSTHRHIGMCQRWPIEKQIQVAVQLISGILSGAIPLARSSKFPGLWIDEGRNRAEHPAPDEAVIFTTWDEYVD